MANIYKPFYYDGTELLSPDAVAVSNDDSSIRFTASDINDIKTKVENSSFSTPIEATSSIIQLPSTVAKGALSVTTYGNALYNYANNGIDYANWTIAGTGTTKGANGIHLVSDGSNDKASIPTILKASTMYTAFVLVKANTLDSTFVLTNNMSPLNSAIVANAAQIGLMKVAFTTKDTITTNGLYFNTGATSGAVDFELYALLEGDYTTGGLVNVQVGKLTYGVISTLNATIKSVGKNLLQNGNCENGINNWAAIGSSPLLSIVNNKFQLTTSGLGGYYQIIYVEPNTNYYASSNVSGVTSMLINNSSGTSTLRTGTGTFNTGSNSTILVYMRNSTTGTGTFDSVMLIKGTTAPDVYEPYTETTASIPVELKSVNGVKDVFNVTDGKHTKNVSDWVTLDGSLDWNARATAYSGFKSVYLNSIIGIIGQDVKGMLLKPNNLPINQLTYGIDFTAEGFTLDNRLSQGSGKLYIAVNNSDTGFAESYSPSNSEWKAYFYGWIMCNSNGTVPWDGVQTKYWKKVLDGTGITSTLPSVSYNGYTPYKMIYQLASPITKQYNPQYLTANTSGTIYIENKIKESKQYQNEILIDNTSLPIKSLTSVYKVDVETGNKTDILSTCTINSDKLGFTSTGAVNDDYIEFEYEYDSTLSTIPTLQYSYPINIKAQTESNTNAIQQISKKIDNLDDLVYDTATEVLTNQDSTPIEVTNSIISLPSDADGALSATVMGNTWINIAKTTQTDYEQGTIALPSGTNAASSYNIRTIGYIAVLPNTQYSVNYNSLYDLYIYEYTSGDVAIGRILVAHKQTFITSATTSKLRLMWRLDTDSTAIVSSAIDTIKPTIIQGSQYSENFFSGVQSTNCVIVKSVGKNLLRNGNGEEGLNYLECRVNDSEVGTINNSNMSLENGYYTIKGQYWLLQNYLYIPVKSGVTYTVQANAYCSSPSAYRFSIRYFDSNKSFVTASGSTSSYTNTTDAIQSYTFTVPDGVSYVRFTMKNWSSTGTLYMKNIMLFQGSTSTAYESYTETSASIPVELKSVNTVKDVFNVNEGKLTKNISDWVVLDGSLGWTSSANYVGYKLAQCTISKSINASEYIIKYNGILLTHVVSGTSGDQSALTSNILYINIYNSDSGWTDAMTPTAGEVKAYFYGWKMCASDGTAYVSGTKYWKKMTDGTGITSTLPIASYSGYTPYKMIYQLDNPVVSYFTPQTLLAKSKGTLYILNQVSDIKDYNNGITIDNTSLPIKSLVSVNKVVKLADNSLQYVPIATSSCSIATGGLSFTSTALTNGDRVEFTYEYESSLSTIPTVKYSFTRNFKSYVESMGQQLVRLNETVKDLIMSMI